ncbi:MAG TPA: hypothetical protein PK668_06405 [Myxococcota bacterium]|nr:hypothetical protein [Myxococcota bacterium]HRY92526.1 hypothetical protein [Myxococcota bacterium]
MSLTRVHPLERVARCRQALVLKELCGLRALRRQAARVREEAGARREEAERARSRCVCARGGDQAGGPVARLALAAGWRLRCERAERAAVEAAERAGREARQAAGRLAGEERRLARELETPRRLAELGARLRRAEARRRQERGP